ncbi:FecR family protein [Phenylobacterium deserti]|nr:FecR domain-containing protein [Phenylobacterium deserti]
MSKAPAIRTDRRATEQRAPMVDERQAQAVAREEAAAWFARLNNRAVSVEALQDFHAWRRRPGNRRAYEAVEAAWRASGRLAEDPEIAALARAALTGAPSREAPSRSRRRLAIALAAAAAVALLAAIGVAYSRVQPETFETPVGAPRQVRLADGSQLTLDTASRVRVRLTPRARTVELERGQVLFAVAHDAARPFTVVAFDVQVRALGTRFEVDRKGAQLAITLLQGAVEVRGPDQARSWALRPGQQLRLAGGAAELAPVDVAEAEAWTSGRITLRDTPLAAAVAEVNRYSREPVRLEAPDLADARVSGVFQAGDNAAFVAAAQALYDLEVHRENGAVRLTRRSGADENPRPPSG